MAVPEAALQATFFADCEDFSTRWADLEPGQSLPSWLRGSLLRNGCGRYSTQEGGRLRHFFDGYGFLTRWDLDGASGRFRCRGRFVDSASSRAVRRGRDGRARQMEFAEFGTPPGRDGRRDADGLAPWLGAWRSVLSGVTDNANVNLVRLRGRRSEDADQWLALSEPCAAQFAIDSETLLTERCVGRPSFPPPLIGPLLQTAHPQWSSYLQGLVNVATQLVPKPCYQVTLTRSVDQELQTRTLLELPCGSLIPAWVHSFALAGDFLVLVEMPCRYNFGAIMGFSDLVLPPASHICMDWDARSATRVHVVPLRDPSSAVVHELPPVFFFHVAQAAVWRDGAGRAKLLVDLCTYEDASILQALSLERMLGQSEPLTRNSHLQRLELPLPGDPGQATLSELCEADRLGNFVDFPQVATAAGEERSRFIYAACAHGRTTVSNCLARVDTATGDVRTWSGASGAGDELVGEPKVVSAPGAAPDAAGGVLLVSACDSAGASLVVLDAERMEEIARCRAPETDDGLSPVMPYPLHGEWLPVEPAAP